jgi:hypothetical protein
MSPILIEQIGVTRSPVKKSSARARASRGGNSSARRRSTSARVKGRGRCFGRSIFGRSPLRERVG